MTCTRLNTLPSDNDLPARAIGSTACCLQRDQTDSTFATKRHHVPLSQELRAMLELRQYDPDGEEFERDAFVFVNEGGDRLIMRTSPRAAGT